MNKSDILGKARRCLPLSREEAYMLLLEGYKLTHQGVGDRSSFEYKNGFFYLDGDTCSLPFKDGYSLYKEEKQTYKEVTKYKPVIQLSHGQTLVEKITYDTLDTLFKLNPKAIGYQEIKIFIKE